MGHTMGGWTKQEIDAELARRQAVSAAEDKARLAIEAKRRLSAPIEDRCIHCNTGKAGRSGLCDDCLHAE